MKRFLVLTSIVCTGLLLAQTRVRVTTTFDRADLSDRVVMLIAGKTELVALDSSLVLDKSVSPPVLRAPAGSFSVGRDIFAITTNVTQLILTAPPKGLISVVRNGLEQNEAEDFTLNGSTISFDKLTQLQVGDKILVVYLK